MKVLSSSLGEVEAGVYRHWCPGCDTYHDLCTSPPLNRTVFCMYDGHPEKPTFSPSIRIRVGGKLVCHYFLSEGVLHYCNDSQHSLAGKSVDLPKLPISAFHTEGLPLGAQ